MLPTSAITLATTQSCADDEQIPEPALRQAKCCAPARYGSIMHERPRRPHFQMMDRMRITWICFGLPAVLVAGAGLLSVAEPASGAFLVSAQQQSDQTQAAPDSGEPSPAADQGEGLTLSDELIRDVFQPLQTGMQTQNIQMVLSIFDKKELTGWADLQAQLRAFFHQYDQVNFRYQILQVTAAKDSGTATADIEMDALPYNFGQVPSRRSVQMRFQIKLGAKGWKVAGFSPADFFSVGFQQPAR
jgi:hypothetical protein